MVYIPMVVFFQKIKLPLPLGIGQKTSYPQDFEIQLVPQPFQCFKSPLFCKKHFKAW